jgi:hypothetical protein
MSGSFKLILIFLVKIIAESVAASISDAKSGSPIQYLKHTHNHSDHPAPEWFVKKIFSKYNATKHIEVGGKIHSN